MSNEQQNKMADAVTLGTTTFVTESVIQEQTFNENPHRSSILPVQDQSIADFLGKPYLIYSGTWATSSTANDVLLTSTVSPYLTSVGPWANKIQGFNLVRGTCCIRIVINANPFQQGKLITSFVPDIGQTVFRGWDLVQKTQQPNVELDCRDATSLIKIPYIATTDWFDRQRGFSDWGRFTISVLSPLKVGSGGENSINFTVFMYFEDFELAAPIVAQSGIPGKRKARSPRVVVAHSSREASGIVGTGVISKGLSLGADMATAVSGIPVLSAIATPASWVMRGASEIAAWFGWSKPELEPAPHLSSRRLIQNMSNATGASLAPTLALFHDNAVDVMEDMAGNGLDEMSFQYLKMRKAFIISRPWSVNDAPETVIYQTNIVPNAFGLTTSQFKGASVASLRSMPPVSYLARYFMLWRGSIDILIKMVKTDFHSGRLLITFTPGPQISTLPTNETSILALREVVDVRGKSEILLKMPYLVNTPYLRNDQLSGVLKISVLNELRAPETCSSTVDFLVYISAGDDFELAVPNQFGGTAKPPFYPQCGIVAQSGIAPDIDQKLVDEPIGGYQIPSFDLEPCRTCIGECFTSVKQLLSRYTPLQTLVTVVGGSANLFGMYPYASQICSMDGGGELLAPEYNSDAICHFSGGYAFFRGGVRIAARSKSFVDQTPIAMLNTDSQLGGPLFVSGDSFGPAANHLADPREDQAASNPEACQIFDAGIGAMEVRVPYYCQTHMSSVGLAPGVRPEGQSDPNAMLFIGIDDSGASSPYPYRLYRSASDEYQLAYFLGFPPVLDNFIPG